MSKPFVSICINASFNIFSKPVLSKKLNNLIDLHEKQIKKRFQEIVNYLESKYPDKIFDYIEYREAFKDELCSTILKKAIEITINDNTGFNIIKNSLSVINEQTIIDAINGPEVIDAFSDILMSIERIYDLRLRFSNLYYR